MSATHPDPTHSRYDLVMWRNGRDFRPTRQQPEWVFSVPELDDVSMTHQIVSSVIDGIYAAESALDGSPYRLCLTICESGKAPTTIPVEEIRSFAISKGVHQVFGQLHDVVPRFLAQQQGQDPLLSPHDPAVDVRTDAALTP